MPVTRLNHAVLYVRDVNESVAFYRDALGFRVVNEIAQIGAAFLQASGSTNDHDLGLFQIGAQAEPSGAGRTSVGLYHLAWEVDTLEELARLADELSKRGALVGASDHSTTKSLYGKDLDGIEFEIAWVVPAALIDDETLSARSAIKPLDLPREIERFGADTRGGVGVSALGVIDLLRPALVAALGALGVTIARDNLTDGPLIVGVAVALAAVCLVFRERGAAVAALGIGAAGAFAAPDGIGPLLVATGAVLACDPASVDRRLMPWRDVLEAGIALPALAGLAGTVAAQPSLRGVALGVAAAVAILATAWRGSSRANAGGLLVVPGLACVAAFVVALAPDRIESLGDLPAATVQGARSVAAGLAVFALVVLVGAVQAERAAPAAARHRRATR